MQCHELCKVWGFTADSIIEGSYICEPKARPENQFSFECLDVVHSGKDAAIEDMLAGGNGYPFRYVEPEGTRAMFDAGATQERRDLRSMLIWARNLSQALADRKRGVM